MENLYLNNSFNLEANKTVKENLKDQYTKVIIDSLIISFGLDIFIKDQIGGDVDTIQNVGDTDYFRNKKTQNSFDNRLPYDGHKTHSHSEYVKENHRIKISKESGMLFDGYTGENFARNAPINLEHVVSGKEAYDDKTIFLSGTSSYDIVNIEENYTATNPSINKGKGAKTVNDVISKLPEQRARLDQLNNKPNLSTSEQNEKIKLEKQVKFDEEQAIKLDKQARSKIKSIAQKNYYTSKKFYIETCNAALKKGVQMGVKQAIGFVLTEIVFSIKKELDNLDEKLNIINFFESLPVAIKKGYESAKEKYNELISKVFTQAIAGAVSSFITTLCNVFFTTAKNIVKIIRHTGASIAEAVRILVLNPDNLLFGERIKSTAKVIAVGASVISGVLVSEAVSKMPIVELPIIGNVFEVFLGAVVTGVLSCTLLHYIDNSKIIQEIVDFFNTADCVERTLIFLKEQSAKIDLFIAELIEVDLSKLNYEIKLINSYIIKIDSPKLGDAESELLHELIKKMQINIPWEGDFDKFMQNKDNVLRFS